jgi:class 3 adenylate cyclase/tetratricopeptide (TPR) repeat protein
MSVTEERRLVTVLFADVTGSTGLGETLDPEALRHLLARYFAIGGEVVDAHGGTVEKFIGDAIMAVFGMPTAHGDDADRALDAALELRDRVRADPVLGDQLPIRLGVNTGEVVASRGGDTGDFLVTGDAVNVAARLQQSAEPWSIVVGERTAAASRGAFTFRRVGALPAKGRIEPVVASELVGRGAPRRVQRTPLVGRAGDLAQLMLAADRAFEERRPFLVSVIAAPGVGKTRLLEEAVDRMRVTRPDLRVAIAQCLPYGQRLTYLPMRTLLLDLLDLPDDLPSDALRRAIGHWLDDAGDPAPARTAELLAATIGAGEGDLADPTALFGAWRSTIELAARRRPLVLVIEDLHWSSDSLLDLVESVLQPRTDVPLLMVALARPELLDRRPTWGGGRRNFISLTLEPLEDREVADLVTSLLDGAGPGVVGSIVDRADGNPFYAGEIVRSIVEQAPDLRDDAAVAAGLAALPDTVQATILARLDLLPQGARRLLQLGAVLGRTFRLPAVAALAPELADQGETLLDELILRDLVRPVAGRAVEFRHILIREVAYGTLTRTERVDLHAAAGTWLETSAGEDADALAELIAYHYQEAVNLSRLVGKPVDPDARRRAIRWLERAASVAEAGAATQEARRHLRAAIDLAEPGEQPELYLRLGSTHLGTNDAIAAFARAYDLGREHGQPPDFLLDALAQRLMAMTRWFASVARQQADEFERLVGEARALLEVATDDRVKARFHISQAFVPFWLGNLGRPVGPDDLARADAEGRQGLAIAERLDDVSLVSAALDGLGAVEASLGDHAAAAALARRRLGLEDRLSFQERLDAVNVYAWQTSMLGELDETAAASTQALATVQPGQDPAFTLAIANWPPYAYALLGRWDEVAAATERCRQLWLDGGRPTAGYALTGLIAGLEVLRSRGDESGAESISEVVGAIVDAFEDQHPTRRLADFIGPDAAGLADGVLGHWSTYGERLHHVERALAICADRHQPIEPAVLDAVTEAARARTTPPLLAQSLRTRGLQRGDIDDLREALDLFTSIRAIPYQARVEIELGRLLDDAAMVALGAGRLERIGDVAYLGREGLARD